MDGDRLTFDVQVLEGDLAGADGAASVFIDIIGMPWTPLSFAGVARRTAARPPGMARQPRRHHPFTRPRRPRTIAQLAGITPIRRVISWASYRAVGPQRLPNFCCESLRHHTSRAALPER